MTEHIKINDRAPRLQYAGTGAQTVFGYDFPIFADGDLKVYVAGALQTAGYTVTGAGTAAGGTVTFAAAPANGARIVLLRDLPVQRLTDFVEGGAFHAKTINDELDRQTAFIQQNETALARALAAGALDDLKDSGGNALSLELPAKSARANRALAFDAQGRPIASGKTLGEIESGADTAAAAAAAAATSASAAEASALAAAISHDSFDDRYLGAKAADPALDNDGQALLIGALYFNTALNEMRAWTGGAWLALPPTPVVPVASGGTGATTAANARTNLGLGTAATRNATGGAGNLAALDTANSWSATQIFQASDDGAAANPQLIIDRHSASPAASDQLGTLIWRGRDSGGNADIYAEIIGGILDLTAGSEDGRLDFRTGVAGALTVLAMSLRQGLTVGASGADPGAGKVNALNGYQRNGVELPVQTEFVSANQTITSAGILTLAHGLGVTPKFVLSELICTGAEQGYAMNDVVQVFSAGTNAGDAAGSLSLAKDATNVVLRFSHATGVFAVPHKTTGAFAQLTNANWQLRLRAYA